jgi:hypothetical protein
MILKTLLFPLAGVLVLAGCHPAAKPPPPMPADQLAAAIEKIRQAPRKRVAPPSRFQTLAEGEVGARFKAPPLCRLTRGGDLLLVARAGEALARVDGRMSVLAFGGPVNPEGGFFTGPGVSVSVGRHAPVGSAAQAPGVSWPVGVTVGGSPKLPPEKLDGVWTCEI